MALGVIKLSKTKRKLIGIVLILLNLLQIGSGTTMIILSIYVYTTLAPMLYSERAEINFVCVVVSLFAVELIIIYCWGMKVCYKCLNRAYKKSTDNFVCGWIFSIFLINTCLLIIAINIRKVYKHIMRSIRHALHIGMQNYLTDTAWKMTIDHLQYNLKCCGIQSYKDWHEIGWLTHYHIDKNSQFVNQLRVENTEHLPVTPFSCCRLDFQMQCLHDPIQQTKLTHLWAEQPALIEQSLNTIGCLDQLRTPIYATIVAFILLVVFSWIVQIFAFLIVRLLYTSSRNAEILGDPDGVAPGWIFGRGDFGINRGKTLSQIMKGNNKRQSVQDIGPEYNTNEHLLTTTTTDEVDEDR